MYRIEQHEPEGWEKAFVIYFGAKRITHAAFRDTAEGAISKMICAY